MRRDATRRGALLRVGSEWARWIRILSQRRIYRHHIIKKNIANIMFNVNGHCGLELRSCTFCRGSARARVRARARRGAAAAVEDEGAGTEMQRMCGGRRRLALINCI